MNSPRTNLSKQLRLQPLAACLTLSCLGAVATNAVATISEVRTSRAPLDVVNCDDDGPGSLRAAVAAAVSGDSIDLTALACGTITLTTGYIAVPQDDLTVLGPGAATLTIDGGGQDGVLRHTGGGTLTVSGLAITHGHYESATAPRGGCLYSAANLSVTDSTLSYCAAVGTSSVLTLGGAIYTHGDLTLLRTSATDSYAQGMAYGAHGGGVYVQGNFTATDSAISRNQAFGAPINGGQGGGAMIAGTTTLKGTTISDNGSFSVGGLYTMGDVTLDSSTISGNGASHAAGMRAIYTSGSPTAKIINSTIAYNHSVATVGGLNLIIPATISNSTIAFNEAFNGLAGVLMSGPTLDLESTIIAGNVGFNVPDDFQVYGSPVITGANNLVIASGATLPPDTLTDDPLMGVLGDYGGPTQTIPLLDGSPAIDAGNDVALLQTDQRGAGFPRVVGPNADIGAFEVQGSDVIFADGFDPP
jgi:hypothetical protein